LGEKNPKFICIANKRRNAMKDGRMNGQTEEEMVTSEVSDEALEAAAGMIKDRAGAFTLAFCSGLDTCPA
jgi:hypothetical protein